MTASLEALAAHRREISEIASTLRAMLSPDQLQIRPVAQVAKRLLCDLCDRVAKHLIEEDKDLYPSLMAHGDLLIQSMAWGFQAGDRPLRRQFEAYHQRWLKDCDFEFTEQFLDETVELLDAIELRLKREQQVMIPQLEDSGIFPVTAA